MCSHYLLWLNYIFSIYLFDDSYIVQMTIRMDVFFFIIFTTSWSLRWLVGRNLFSNVEVLRGLRMLNTFATAESRNAMKSKVMLCTEQL